MKSLIKRVIKTAAQQTLGRLPAPATRLTGKLARFGGRPVRDLRLRPWAGSPNHSLLDWFTRVGPAMRQVYFSRSEGLPQTRQKEFAQRFAAFCGCKHALMLPHGTDALRFALAAALDHDGLDHGGEVIVPNLSFIASATSALDRRLGVAFVDVDPGTLNLDPRRVEQAIIPGRTRAIMAVHQFGQPADMTALRVIADRHGLKLIEDAAQSHGAVWETGPVGSLGEAAGFSFQSAKNLSCGEGGLLTTNDTEIFERVQSMHNAGRAPGGGARWEHPFLGWNCRPTEYQAVLLLQRFRHFEAQQERRAENFARLRQLLGDVRCVRPLAVHPGVRKHGMYMFVLRYEPGYCGGCTVDEFLQAVGAEGVPLNRCYTATLSEQGCMKALRVKRPDYIRVLPTPEADLAATDTLYLAANVFLGNEADMQDIADALRKVERHFNRS